MAHFHAAGTIASDIVRRETGKGVIASFRLASGVPGQSQHWITVETRGRVAGSLNAHGQLGRGISVAGRLVHNAWRDKATGAARSKLSVAAMDIDLLGLDPHPSTLGTPNHVVANGRLTAHPEQHGDEQLSFTIVSGQANAKTGKLWLPVEAWGRTLSTARGLVEGDHVTVAGRLSFRSRPNLDGEKVAGHELSAYSLVAWD